MKFSFNSKFKNAFINSSRYISTFTLNFTIHSNELMWKFQIHLPSHEIFIYKVSLSIV